MRTENEYRAYSFYLRELIALRETDEIKYIDPESIEFDAFDELLDSHDANIEFDDAFLIAHINFNQNALAHYENAMPNCRCDEFCAYDEGGCAICDN